MKYYKGQRAPKYTQKQLEEIPGKCRKLRREFTDQETFIIVDDEKYFTFSGWMAILKILDKKKLLDQQLIRAQIFVLNAKKSEKKVQAPTGFNEIF